MKQLKIRRKFQNSIKPPILPACKWMEKKGWYVEKIEIPEVSLSAHNPIALVYFYIFRYTDTGQKMEREKRKMVMTISWYGLDARPEHFKNNSIPAPTWEIEEIEKEEKWEAKK